MWSDANYLYVCAMDNVVKGVKLSDISMTCCPERSEERLRTNAAGAVGIHRGNPNQRCTLCSRRDYLMIR